MAVENKLKKNWLFFRFTWVKIKSFFTRVLKSLYPCVILFLIFTLTGYYLSDGSNIKQLLELATTLSLILFVFLFLITKNSNPLNIIISGAEGETQVLKKLKELDNDFVLFNRMILPDEKTTIGIRELDFIAISKKAIYIIEVKNNRGYVVVENMADRWHVEKKSQNNKIYSKMIKNPIRQTFAQKKVLQTYLYKQRVYVKGIPVVTVVVFANEDVKLSDSFISDDANQAVVCMDSLIPFIKAKEEYLKNMAPRVRKKAIRKLEKR